VQCAKSQVKTLYLGRYLLELSLMDYKFVFRSESMMAAAALYIARIMRDEGPWVSGHHSLQTINLSLFNIQSMINDQQIFILTGSVDN
jgi:hypothetical protein